MASSFVCGNSSVACFGKENLLSSGSSPQKRVSLSSRTGNLKISANDLTILCQARGSEQDKLYTGKEDQYGSSKAGQSAKMKKPLTNVKRVAMLAYIASMVIREPTPTSDVTIILNSPPLLRQETVRVSVQKPRFESLVARISLADAPSLQGDFTVCDMDEPDVCSC